MQMSDADKCVLVIDEGLESGLVANTAAVLSMAIGASSPTLIGPDVTDGNGSLHTGITTIPIPILRADHELVEKIRHQAVDNADLFVVDVTDAAQTTKNYDDYMGKMKTATNGDLRYLGVALLGRKKQVNKLTGNLPLFR